MAFLESVLIGTLLVAVLLPATVVFGGLAFLPRDPRYWTWAHVRGALRRDGPVLGAMVAMVAIFSLQVTLDKPITAWLGWDFTPAFAAFDGGLHRAVQAAAPRWLVVALALVYLLGFPVVIYLTPILGAWLGDRTTVLRGFGVFAGLYILALPFYLFFPVSETWTTGAAENLVLITPWTETVLYAFNDVNNAFPSMHTAMAIASAWAAWRIPSRAYRAFAATMATLIPVSTIVLGIHWSLDVAAGLVCALVVILVVRRAVPSETAPPAPAATATG